MSGTIEGKVVVIAGASSGIGRAAALEFAARGARLVLAARREAPLKDLARECLDVGGAAFAVPTDVSDERAVEELARRAVERFGRIDVWVNNASVSLFSRFEETPTDAFRRVIETNLFGYVHGAKAAIRHFREQGRGVLINVSSMVSKVGQPFTSAYVSSKFAITGLSECLRMELMDTPGIQVSTVLPASIDTPLFQHAANYTGRAVKAMTPVYPARQVAQAIVAMASSPKREVFVGNSGRMLNLMHTIAPGFAERRMANQVNQDHFADRPADPSPGNLFEPMPRYSGVSGGWMTENRSQGGAGLALGIGLLGVGLGLAAWWLATPDRRQRAGEAWNQSTRQARAGAARAAGWSREAVRDARRWVEPLVS